MKKLLSIILTLCVILSLAACSGGSETASADPSSSDASSKPKPLGGEVSTGDDDSSDSADANGDFAIEHKSVAQGYINHSNIYSSNIVNFNGFECMDDEYMFIPKGTTIISDNSCAIFCYELDGNKLVLAPKISEKIGCTLTPSGLSVQHTSGTFEVTEDIYVRISAQGTLDDVQIFPPKELIDSIKLFTAEELIAELSK